MAVGVVPVLLVLAAAVPRVWAPDLVPYGDRQAAYVLDAIARSADPWSAAYADPAYPPLALLDPVLRELPSPVVIWVVLRALLDAVGVGLLYLAARPLVGTVGAILAAFLYAANPTAWAAARDPAGPFSAVLVAGALLAAVRLLDRPTMVRAVVLGVCLGLAARSVPPGWAFVLAGAVALAVARASWRIGGAAALALVLAAGPALWHNLDRLTTVLLLRWDALALPGWIVQGVAYARDGYPPGAELPVDWWRPVAALALVVLVAGCAVAVRAACRGDARLLLGMAAGLLGLLDLLVTGRPPDRLETLLGTPRGLLWLLDGDRSPVAVCGLSLFVAQAVCWAGATRRVLSVVAVAAIILIEAAAVGTVVAGAERASGTAQPFHHAMFGQYWDIVRDISNDGYFHEATGTVTSLRDWSAVASAVKDGAARIGAAEVVLHERERNPVEPPLESLLRGTPRMRRLPENIGVLPLARDTPFLAIPAGARLGMDGLDPPALASSTTAVVHPEGHDTGVRVLTVRPRAAEDWLMSATTVPDGRFADGSTLLGVAVRASAWRDRFPSMVLLTLYWTLPTVTSAGVGHDVRIDIAGENAPVMHPPVLARPEVRRPDEIVAQVLIWSVLPHPDQFTIQVGLRDDAGRPIQTMDGRAAVDVRIGPVPP